MKLYFSKGACSLAVRIIINELGVDCDYEGVDLKTKETESGKNFLEINPKGVVPVLETEDGVILTENVVIQQYLADKFKAYSLLPEFTDFERYRVLEWLGFIATEIHKGYGPLFNPDTPQNVKDEIAIPNLMSKFNYINENLSSSKFIHSDEFSLADSYLFVMIFWANVIFKLDFSKFEHINRYFTELKERNSVKEAMQQEGLS